MRPAILIGVLLTAVFAGLVHAQEPLREHTLESEWVQGSRHIRIALPDSYQQHPAQQYPVLYLLDGENNLDYTQAVSRYLASNGLIPELMIVAIRGGASRGQDYLPANNAEGSAPSGQAHQFRRFIADELMPFVEQQYRAAPLSILSGHSYGGLFVLDTLASQPSLFQGYIAQSPYLDKQWTPLIIESLQDSLTQINNQRRFLQILVGDEPELLPGIGKLDKLLNEHASNGLRWFIQRDPGKTHMTTRMIGQYNGLELLFNDWSLPEQTLASGDIDQLRSHIAQLSEAYGYKVLYSQQPLALATQMQLQQQQFELAEQFASLYLGHYPNSLTAHYMMANSLLAAGKQDAALQTIEKALTLSAANPKPESQAIVQALGQLQQKLRLSKKE
ncbi:MAG: hypothetical protein Tsb002_33460 [Wenzhouxiangellaceae bacterium]